MRSVLILFLKRAQLLHFIVNAFSVELVPQLACWMAGWLANLLPVASWLAGCGWLALCLAGRPASWPAGWLAGGLAPWLAGFC